MTSFQFALIHEFKFFVFLIFEEPHVHLSFH
jgi:hypothetical protein